MIINLRRRIAEWIQRGIISEEIAEKILAFEASRESKAWIGFGIAGVGITALITGFISIVAANWESLSDGTKIVGYFVAQSLLGALLVWGMKKRFFWREVFINLFGLFFWAGIALVGQVYNIDEPAWRSLSFWLVLALPAALIANSRLLPSLWCATALADVFSWAFEGASSGEDIMRRSSIAASLPMLMTALFFWSKGRNLLQEEFRAALLRFGLLAILAVSTPMADMLWSSGGGHYIYKTGITRHLSIPWAAAALAAIAALAARESVKQLKIATATLIVAAMAYLTLPLMIPALDHLLETQRMFLGALGFIVVWSIAAASAALADRKRLYDVATFVIACRFIVAYFQVFGSLTTTGVGLVISGAVILAIGAFWDRLRRKVIQRARG